MSAAVDFKETPLVVDKWWNLHGIQTGAMTQLRLPITWKPYDKGLNIGFSGLDPGLYNTCSARSGWVLRSRDGRGTWNDRTKPVHSPLGYAGDRLWIKEIHAFTGHSHDYEDVTYKDGVVKAMKTSEMVVHSNEYLPAEGMPRWASRTVLEVTDVRVERLWNATDDDIKASGYTRFAVSSALAPLAEKAQARAQHWLSGDGQDEAISWCLKCATKEVSKLQKKGKKEVRVDGGFDVQDEDSVRFCEGCGHVVEYHLTDYGVREFFPVFEKEPELKSPVDAYEASKFFESDESYYPEIQQGLRRLGFRYIWDAAHGKDKLFRWEKNPWTWVIQFRVLSHLS